MDDLLGSSAPSREERSPAPPEEPSADTDTPADLEPKALRDDPLVSGGLFAGLFDEEREVNESSGEPTPGPPAEPSTPPATSDPPGVGVEGNFEEAEDDESVAELLPISPPEAAAADLVDVPRPLLRPEQPTLPQEAEVAPDRPRRDAEAPIPLDAKNTRHLAWLLGAKATVLALAQIGGVEDARQSQWQVDALADLLSVPRPNNLAEFNGEESMSVVVGKLLEQSRTSAAQLRRRHGVDHAALLEIALKSNALLVLYEDDPSLAKPVRKAVEAAAEQARLPGEALAPLLAALDGGKNADEVRAAVHATHRAVEQLLRKEG